jgi:hypothetical protein
VTRCNGRKSIDPSYKVPDVAECTLCGERRQVFGVLIHRERNEPDLFCRDCRLRVGLAVMRLTVEASSA